MTRLYIAGPMSNLPEFNYPAFREAAKKWRDCGWDVLDPSEKFGGRTDLPYEVYIKASIIDVLASEAIAVLPGWENSKGATLEVSIGRALGYPIYDGEHPARSGGGGLRPPSGRLLASSPELSAHR
jgi:hypothetical protein